MIEFAYETITENGEIAITTDTEKAEQWSEDGFRVTATKL
jgi:hypothetical protein